MGVSGRVETNLATGLTEGIKRQNNVSNVRRAQIHSKEAVSIAKLSPINTTEIPPNPTTAFPMLYRDGG